MSTTNPFQAPVSDSPSYDSSALAAPLTMTEVLFSFDGRIGRRTYWLASVGVAVVYYGVMGLSILVGMIPLIGPIWSFVECGLLPGTPGTNECGRDPVGS